MMVKRSQRLGCGFMCAALIVLCGAGAPAGFSEYGTGDYTLVALNGGTLDGSFSRVIPPDRMTAEVDTSSGDVVLTLVKRPSGTTIMVR